MYTHNAIIEILVNSYEKQEPLSVNLTENILLSLSENSSAEVRSWFAKSLVYHDSHEFAVRELCKLARDKNALVRVEAVDSLSFYVTQESFETMCMSLNDEDELVRAYAAFGLAVIGRVVSKEQAIFLLDIHSKREESCRTLVGIYEGLYILGKDENLRSLIDLFHSKDYHVQCAVLHALDEIVAPDNLSELKHFVDSIDISLCVPAVAGVIRQLKKTCCEMAMSLNHEE